MPVWLLQSLRSVLSPRHEEEAARLLGERETDVHEAVTIALHVIVAAVAVRADDATAMRQVASLFPRPASDELTVAAMGPRPLGDPAFAAARDAGEALLVLLFAGRRDAIASAIATHVGVRTDSVWSLLAWLAPVFLAGLAARVRAGTTPVGLWAMFQAQRAELVNAVPIAIAELLESPSDPRAQTSRFGLSVNGGSRSSARAWRRVMRLVNSLRATSRAARCVRTLTPDES